MTNRRRESIRGMIDWKIDGFSLFLLDEKEGKEGTEADVGAESKLLGMLRIRLEGQSLYITYVDVHWSEIKHQQMECGGSRDHVAAPPSSPPIPSVFAIDQIRLDVQSLKVLSCCMDGGWP